MFFSGTMIKNIGHASPSSHKEASTSVSLCASLCVCSFLDVHMLALKCLHLLMYMQTLDFAVSYSAVE